MSNTPLEPATRVGKAPAPGKKYTYKPEAHPITDPGFDDSKNWFKNTVQRDQLYMQKRNLPTHRVMPYDRIFNTAAYAGGGAFFLARSMSCVVPYPPRSRCSRWLGVHHLCHGFPQVPPAVINVFGIDS